MSGLGLCWAVTTGERTPHGAAAWEELLGNSVSSDSKAQPGLCGGSVTSRISW